MTDLEMLKRIKNENDLEIRNLLWEKYQAKVASSFFKNAKFFNDIGLSLEDYKQEAFFSFIDCIEYIDLEKMENSESNFGTSFYFFLLKIKNKNQRELAHMGIPIYLSSMESKDEVDESTSGLKKAFNSKTAIDFDDQLKTKVVSSIVQKYVSEQPEKKRQILQMYMEDVSVKDISERMKMNYMKVYKFIRSTKNELTTIYSNAIV
jgi:DNA-directed RNA polymerase specialized sigma subunit